MCVPLDRLYNYLDGLCNHDILIYRFLPHGSKNLEDLKPLNNNQDWFALMTKPLLICHDQEPLQYDLHQPKDFDNLAHLSARSPILKDYYADMHFRNRVAIPHNCFDKTLLTHSELNSSQVDKFEQHNFIGVYWWSHAAIARDWYRYAEHDPILRTKNACVDFLIYNRAWAGTREYRLKFTELLVDKNLVSSCNVRFNPVDQVHYTQHQWDNPALAVTRCNLEDFVEYNDLPASASADYDAVDYSSCGIEVVLETLFDDTRQHLTEKTLRPIATGCPFILAATPGSLEYLKNYGFKTFSDYIDESYDKIQDPVKRLKAITDEMRRISMLDPADKKQLWANLNAIADYNKKLFFSEPWYKSIFQEFVNNLNHSLNRLWESRQGTLWRTIKSNTTKEFYDPSGKILYFPGYQSQLIEWLEEDVPKIQAPNL